MSLQEKKIFMPDGSDVHIRWLNGIRVHRLDEADVVLFTEGTPVLPSYYGKLPISKNIIYDSHRDLKDKKVFEEAVRLNKKIIGIGRGAELICIMAGGEVIQEQENPLHEHYVKTRDNIEFLVNSFHTTNQYPFNLKPDEYRVLASVKGLSSYYRTQDNVELPLPDNQCPEIVFYKKVNGLAFQFSPEMMLDKTFTNSILPIEKILVMFYSNFYNKILDEQTNVASRINNYSNNYVN